MGEALETVYRTNYLNFSSALNTLENDIFKNFAQREKIHITITA